MMGFAAAQPILQSSALALLQKLDAAGKLNAEQKPMIANIQQVLASPPQQK
jgi:hypothetical protein